MSFIDELQTALGSKRVKTHPLELRVFDKDAGVTRGPVAAVVFPETTSEVAVCIRIAAAHDVPIVGRGAGTGLSGGAVPVEPALIVVMTKMNQIHEIDAEGRTAWVGPGVINQDLSVATAHLGLHYAPDPSSQSACTIGGNVGTNAGGLHCLSEGTTVDHVLALELVTADGEMVRIGCEAPDPIGLDLRGVVVGSEGTLGLVTRVLVRLTPSPPATATMLMSFASIEDAAGTVSQIIASGVIPAALEMMDNAMVRAVENFVGAGFPTDAAAVLLCEVAGHPDGVSDETEVVTRIAAANGASEVRVAQDAAERDKLWLGRKSAFGAVAQSGPDYYLHDTVVPRTRLVEVMRQIYQIAERHQLLMLNVFHAGDGNLHPLMSFDAREPGALERVKAAAEEIVKVSVAAGGALSGEHGIGSEKRDLMGQIFSPMDLDAQARLRDAFDPQGRLNPGKILPHGSRCYDYGMTAGDRVETAAGEP